LTGGVVGGLARRGRVGALAVDIFTRRPRDDKKLYDRDEARKRHEDEFQAEKVKDSDKKAEELKDVDKKAEEVQERDRKAEKHREIDKKAEELKDVDKKAEKLRDGDKRAEKKEGDERVKRLRKIIGSGYKCPYVSLTVRANVQYTLRFRRPRHYHYRDENTFQSCKQ
jgi:hypothetical protein